MALAFINYRRNDTAEAAQAIYSQLKVHFGSGQLFMDVNSIQAGDPWPSHIRTKINLATGMLVLVGPGWLTTCDEWGRREIDLPRDWVTQEISAALARKRRITIVPVLIGKGIECPPDNAIPRELRGLFGNEMVEVRRRTWAKDIEVLVKACREKFMLVERPELRDVAGPYPNPSKQRLPPIGAGALARFLSSHQGWEPWEDAVPREYPRSRQELRKNFVFASFVDAMGFMNAATSLFEAADHHPRWRNEWRLVTIGLTTWDAGNRITSVDLKMATKLDALYQGTQRGGRTSLPKARTA